MMTKIRVGTEIGNSIIARQTETAPGKTRNDRTH